ncbi:unnamed protein product, partial [Rotaria sp. Silwood1]
MNSLQSSSSINIVTSNNISQLISWILTKISYRALQILIKLEIQFPVFLSNSFYSDRLIFFTDIINIGCKTTYSKSIICAIHNAIVIDEEIKRELFHEIDLNELITEYNLLNKLNRFHNDKTLINIMPFTDYCENVKCKRTKLGIKFSTTAHIIFLASVKPCSIFNGICPNCKCIYGPTTIVDPQSNQRIITISSIQNNNYIYFSGDLVYSKEFLSMFSNNLIHAHTTFQGFTESYLNMLIDVHGHHKPIVSSNTLAKRMEVAWIYFELSRFIFLTSREKSIVLPKSLQPESRYIFIEQNLPFFHHLFNTFWSRHRVFPHIKCKQSSCSAVMLIDGHQKSNRKICRHENLTNTNHLELGPVNQGCPYPPHRSKSNEKGKNQNSYYCKHHIKYMNTSINQQRITQSNEYQQAVLIDEEIIRTMDNDDLCNVYRNELKNDKKSRSFGVLVTFLSCGVVIAFTESIRSEGCRRIT